MGADSQVVTRRQAIIDDSPVYFTGKPCKNGHIEQRNVSNRECRECARIASRAYNATRPKMKRDNLCRKAKTPFVMMMNHHHRVLLAIAGLGRISSILQTLGCTRVELRGYIEAHFRPGMSWENQGKWDIELHTPHMQFDLRCPEQRQICFHYTNLRPTWINDHTRI